MACFIVPAVEAVAVTAAYFTVKNHEKKIALPKVSESTDFSSKQVKITWSKRLGWLMSLLWGGVLLLAFEHFWHGEIAPFPPFLTAMVSPEDTAEMLHEMATVGVSMAVFVTAVWGAMCGVAQLMVKKIRKTVSSEA
ncbi:MAG: hypothetical protein K5917_07460 [Clostridiales bacterium]|nr:hypothetical protein [Clostridiales bacterium]